MNLYTLLKQNAPIQAKFAVTRKKRELDQLRYKYSIAKEEDKPLIVQQADQIKQEIQALS